MSESTSDFQPKVDASTLYEYYRTKPDPPYKKFDPVIGQQGVILWYVLNQIKHFNKVSLTKIAS